jgi:hypothetical protein
MKGCVENTCCGTNPNSNNNNNNNNQIKKVSSNASNVLNATNAVFNDVKVQSTSSSNISSPNSKKLNNNMTSNPNV